ncbi:MAG: uroporphyrinogen-III synthase, partial [Gemmatimonadales bacterium]
MKKLVITASSGSFSGLADELRKISVEAIERPLISSRPPDDWARLDEALNHRNRYGSLALTSPRAAAAVADRIRACSISWVGHTPRVWAVGAATAEALQGMLGSVQGSFPEPNGQLGAAERLAEIMLSAGAAGPVLFPCGDNRRDELPAILRANGLVVDEVICYRMVLASAEQARDAVAGASMVLVASPSVLQLLVEACPPSGRPALV